MKSKEMDRKFQEGVSLINSEDGLQDGADILMELAELGHLESIEQLVYIFLDQKDFELAEYYINCAHDPNKPIILYLQARKIEESAGLEEALTMLESAIESGSADACRRLFNIAIENQDIDGAVTYLEKLRDYPAYFANPYVSVTTEDLRQQIEDLRELSEEMKFDKSEENNIATEIHRILTGDEPVIIELVVYLIEKLHLSIPAKALVSALTLQLFTRLDLDEDAYEKQQEEFETFYKEFEEHFLWRGFRGLSLNYDDYLEEREMYINEVKVKAYQSGDSLARILIMKFDSSPVSSSFAKSGESVIHDLSALNSKNISEEWLAFVNKENNPLHQIISESVGENNENYSDNESWFGTLVDEYLPDGDYSYLEGLFSQEGSHLRRRYGFSFWSDYNFDSSCSKCEKKIAQCHMSDCLRRVYGFSTSSDHDLHSWTDPTGGAKIVNGVDNDIYLSFAVDMRGPQRSLYCRVPYIAGYIHSPVSIANNSGVYEGFDAMEGHTTDYIRDIQDDTGYNFKELSTLENDKYIVVAWIECLLGGNNIEEFEKAMVSINQYLNDEITSRPTTHNFWDVAAVSLFAGNWELGFKRWLNSKLEDTRKMKDDLLMDQMSEDSSRANYEDITIKRDYVIFKNNCEKAIGVFEAYVEDEYLSGAREFLGEANLPETLVTRLSKRLDELEN